MKIKNYNIDEIINDINNNMIVVIETDTCYGLISIANKQNVQRINEIKGRQIDKKLPHLICDTKYIKTTNQKTLNKMGNWPPYTTIIFSKGEESYRLITEEPLKTIINKCKGILCSSSFNKNKMPIINSINDVQLKLFQKDNINVYFSTKFRNKKPSQIIEYTNENYKIIRKR